jgi:hypothetical protein
LNKRHFQNHDLPPRRRNPQHFPQRVRPFGNISDSESHCGNIKSIIAKRKIQGIPLNKIYPA